MNPTIAISPSPSYKRLAFLGAAVAVHIVVIVVLATGLAERVAHVIHGPIQTRIIEEVQPKREEPPPPPPELRDLPPYVTPPDITLDYTPEQTTAIQQIQTTIRTPPPKPAPVVRVNARMDPRHQNSRPPYPPMSIRLQEEGTVVLALYVRDDGGVGEARIDQSSGYRRLDEAAKREALRSWRFLPATDNGKPVGSWTRIKFKFRLEDQ